jgi:hypothetical protein
VVKVYTVCNEKGSPIAVYGQLEHATMYAQTNPDWFVKSLPFNPPVPELPIERCFTAVLDRCNRDEMIVSTKVRPRCGGESGSHQYDPACDTLIVWSFVSLTHLDELITAALRFREIGKRGEIKRAT